MDPTNPLQQVTDAVERCERIRRECEQRTAEARQRRDELIRQHAQSARQVDLVKATGFSRETIRRIVAAGSQK